jgi:hypothetical protein
MPLHEDPNIDYKLNFTFNKAQQREIRYALSIPVVLEGITLVLFWKTILNILVCLSLFFPVFAENGSATSCFTSYLKPVPPGNLSLYDSGFIHRYASIRMPDGR